MQCRAECPVWQKLGHRPGKNGAPGLARADRGVVRVTSAVQSGRQSSHKLWYEFCHWAPRTLHPKTLNPKPRNPKPQNPKPPIKPTQATSFEPKHRGHGWHRALGGPARFSDRVLQRSAGDDFWGGRGGGGGGGELGFRVRVWGCFSFGFRVYYCGDILVNGCGLKESCIKRTRRLEINHRLLWHHISPHSSYAFSSVARLLRTLGICRGPPGTWWLFYLRTL